MLEVGKYEKAAATFADYDPRAPQIAELLKHAIEQLEPRIVVEHIGSTAVPGCRGKGIIDLAVTYLADDLEFAKTALDALERNREEHRELIGFRDALRRDSKLRSAYESTKQQILASGITDSLDYTKAKGSFIIAMLLEQGLRPAIPLK